MSEYVLSCLINRVHRELGKEWFDITPKQRATRVIECLNAEKVIQMVEPAQVSAAVAAIHGDNYAILPGEYITLTLAVDAALVAPTAG